MRIRKNYPGDERTPGTKDYSLILGNLMNYRNQLERETNEQKVGELFLKIAEKLKELGFSRPSTSVKRRAGRRKLGKFQDITQKKKEEVLTTVSRYWISAKQKHEEAKQFLKNQQVARQGLA